MEKIKYCILILALVFSKMLSAQNPIVPAGIYIADPSAHQWKDGKIYIYGSRDESPDYYCSHRYDVLSSDDLKTWTLHENTFASKGENDQVNYSDDFLYAPDCQYKDGLYYLYYCLANNTKTEGVAVSKSPEGPFLGGKIIELAGYNEIDPAVFMDDDGQAYYIWGQFNAKIAKLKPNMIEIDTTTIRENVVTEKEHFFHEGAYMVKRNGIYYLIYAHMGRAGKPTCIGYATSKSPMGPYAYGGVIVDNDHSDPKCWNNHGSIAEFNGKWYVLYHRPTHGSNTMRKACVEPLSFRADGSIPEVEMTSQGAGEPFKMSSKIDAERACLLYGNTRIKAVSSDNEALCEIQNDDAVAFKYVDFNAGCDSLKIQLAPGTKGFTIDIKLDNSWGSSIGRINVPSNSGSNEAKTFTCKVKSTTGIHAVWLKFWGTPDENAYIDWLTFYQ
jgi:beta-xylosidase